MVEASQLYCFEKLHQSIFEQYPGHCNRKLFILITSAVGNLAIKVSGQYLVKINWSFLNMKTSKQQNTRKKLAQTRKCWNVKSSMKNWTRKNRKSLISQRLSEKRSILQVLNLKSVQKRIKGSQQIVESVTLPPAPTSMKEPDSTGTSMVESI